MVQEVVKVVAALGILWTLLAAACFPMIVATWGPVIEDVKQWWSKERQQREVNRRFRQITQEEGRQDIESNR